MNPSSTTPRTDAARKWEWIPGQHAFTQLEKHYKTMSDLAETLERELSLLKSKREAAVRYGADSLESDSIENSCNCLKRTPEAQHHKPGCKYRLLSERDAARRECESLRREIQRWYDKLQAADAELLAKQQECERIQKLIADQPCDSDCRSVCGGMFTPTYREGEPPMKCDCWKSEALTNK